MLKWVHDGRLVVFLNLVAPPPAAPRTDLDIDPPPWLRTVDYMVNHICEPTCVRCIACCRSPRGRQCGAKKPLTMYELPQSLLVANPINRYLINSPMLPSLKKDADGGITINVQHESPGKERESNWLPAPK